MADPILVQHLCCTNDTNGNPRRIWAFYDARNGVIVGAQDEGYNSRPEVLRNGSAVELPSIEITTREYREWLTRVEHYNGKFEVRSTKDGFVYHRFYTARRASKWARDHFDGTNLVVCSTAEIDA